MKKIRTVFIWMYMLLKKLLHRWSFLVLLALIPSLLPALSGAMSDESGIVKVALCAENGSGRVAENVIDSLLGEETIVNYVVYENSDEAIEAVKKSKCDAAWIFDYDFEARMNAYLEKKTIQPFMRVIEQEDSISLMLAREKLYGRLYSHITYKLYSDFVRTELLPDENISDEELKEYYDAEKQNDNLIEIKMIDSDTALDVADANYLKTPLRGLLSLLVMLCGFAAAGFFMKERNDGVYDWMSYKSKIIPAFGSCFGAVLLSGVMVLVSVYAGGLNTDVATELSAMAVYIFAATAFCVFLTACFKNFAGFGPFIPFLMIVMLVMCPIFFSFLFLPAVRFSLPPYYYLMAIYNQEYIWYMLIYGVGVMIVSYILYSLRRVK
ncbi:MAG: ABC transporter permease [Clostridia bacterium]|nr:ABC transporter permease [Clostridia bacterium]